MEKSIDNYEIREYKGTTVYTREDEDNYYVDFNTGLGEGIYPKADWTLDKAIEDQYNIG